MPITDESFYKNRNTWLSNMLTALQASVVDAYVGEDGVMRMLFTVEAAQLENLSLANQILLEDMFVQSASLTALKLHGQQYGVAMSDGTLSVGQVRIAGDPGLYLPVGMTLVYDPGTGIGTQFFVTTQDGTIPNAGTPGAPTVATAAGPGMSGDYEYAISFVTPAGETMQGPDSAIVSVSNQGVALTGISIGGPGTTKRRIYRQKAGVGNYNLVGEIANNTTTTFTDTMSDAVAATQNTPNNTDSSAAIILNAQALVPGSDGNVAVGQITVVSDGPGGITDVSNPIAFTGGSDPEDSESFRQKILQQLRAPQTGSPTDLKAWAEEVIGVESATVFNNDNVGVATPGHVTVRISGPGGGVPSTDVQANVLAVLESRGIANTTYHVATFVADVQDVNVDVTLDSTYTLGDVTAGVQNAIDAYINSLPVGGTLYISGIVDAVFGLPGILDVVVVTPSSNQTTTATHKKTPGTITVT
jgi:uncharacterized phage protein gp47/JayE